MLRSFHYFSTVSRFSNFLSTKLPPDLHIKQPNKQKEEEEGGMKGGEGETLPKQRPRERSPERCFNGNNKLLSQAIKSAFDLYRRAEVLCAI